MMSKKKQQIYVTVAAIGLLALAVDQLLLAEGDTLPEMAHAESQSVATHVASPEGTAIPEVPFPGALAAYRLSEGGRDLFQPPATSGNEAGRGSGQSDNGVTIEPTRLGQRSVPFDERHTLNGAIIQAGLRIAVIDERLVKVGETVDACVLKKLADGEAQFECPEGTVVLKASYGAGGTRALKSRVVPDDSTPQ